MPDQIYNRKYKKTEDEAIPESLMLGLYFHGDEKLFDAAKKKGEVFKVTSEGSDVAFWAFCKFVVGSEDGKENAHKTSAHKKITNSDLDALKSAFRTLKWNFNFETVDNTVAEDGGLSEEGMKLLKQAISALEKLSRESKALITSWSGTAEAIKELKAAYSKSLQTSSQLSHIQDLGAFADGSPLTKNAFFSFIKDVAAEMDAFNIVFQRCKGEARARKA
ncbi:unnamed protein product [Symbiodinium sp. CCMP2592]|nr:unnamed protein product [Symbiodinium sp. CCMP2592]